MEELVNYLKEHLFVSILVDGCISGCLGLTKNITMFNGCNSSVMRDMMLGLYVCLIL